MMTLNRGVRAGKSHLFVGAGAIEAQSGKVMTPVLRPALRPALRPTPRESEGGAPSRHLISHPLQKPAPVTRNRSVGTA
jgi:hypothetical protein